VMVPTGIGPIRLASVSIVQIGPFTSSILHPRTVYTPMTFSTTSTINDISAPSKNELLSMNVYSLGDF